jgi:hypothetical protein
MSEHASIAGDWALNNKGQVVAAWDQTRVFSGKTYQYFCVCGCGDTVTLHRGVKLRAHFAYTAGHRNGCTGSSGCKETEIHYNAKWLLYDKFQQINFWRVCGCDHRINKYQFTGPEWTATVEKEIPGTTRIADVLLENSSTGKAIALEVCHKHAVDSKKEDECKLAGVPIFEVEARAITAECRDLNNKLDKFGWDDCATCQRKEQERQRYNQACRVREEND